MRAITAGQEPLVIRRPVHTLGMCLSVGLVGLPDRQTLPTAQVDDTHAIPCLRDHPGAVVRHVTVPRVDDDVITGGHVEDVRFDRHLRPVPALVHEVPPIRGPTGQPERAGPKGQDVFPAAVLEGQQVQAGVGVRSGERHHLATVWRPPAHIDPRRRSRAAVASPVAASTMRDPTIDRAAIRGPPDCIGISLVTPAVRTSSSG